MIDPVILPSAFYWPPELSIWLIKLEKASYQAVINIPDADCCEWNKTEEMFLFNICYKNKNIYILLWLRALFFVDDDACSIEYSHMEFPFTCTFFTDTFWAQSE